MNESSEQIFHMDWRIVFGLTVTSIWIGAGLFYLISVVGLDNFLHVPTGDIGSFLEGAFAPLAFLWLVIGHFMQQKEITANTMAISLQERSARRLEVHSRRDSYFKLLTLVQEQLGNVSAFHYISICGPTGSGEVSMDEFSDMRTQASAGDTSLFIRKMIAMAADNRDDPEKLQEIFYGTEVRTRHSNTFNKTFARLLSAARAVDEDDMISSALLEGSAAGFLYRIMQHVSGEVPLSPITGVDKEQTASG
ncbi:MAG: hypothetical protein RIC89_13110 [Pseudomonadales bacterium]